jgi:hypothetical protein
MSKLTFSAMVKAFLAAVASPSRDRADTVLRSVRGSLNKADLNDYGKYLVAKYR